MIDYVKRGGGFCPYCGSEEITSGGIKTDSCIAWENFECDACLETWTDDYVLAAVQLRDTTIVVIKTESNSEPESEPEPEPKPESVHDRTTIYLENTLNGSSKWYRMTKTSPSTFRAEWGSIGHSRLGTKDYDATEWWRILHQKKRKGYEKVSDPGY